jgi:O-antigen ligase
MILKKNNTDRLIEYNQKYLNWFVFFSIFTAIRVAGISITFFIFLIIVYTFIKAKVKLFTIVTVVDIFLLLFLFFLIISSLISIADSTTKMSTFSTFKLMIQYIYWVILALFLKTWIHRYDFLEISKYFFIASIFSIFYYIVFNKLYFVFNPNEFSFYMVVSIPLSFYYIINTFSNKIIFAISIFFTIGLIWSESRTGLALVLLELFIFIIVYSKRIRLSLIASIVILTPLIFLTLSTINMKDSDTREYKYQLANFIEPISPKYAYTLRLKENVFERDKSFLIRKLMIQKGEIIFKEHPYLGIGIGGFTKFHAELNMRKVSSRWLKRSQARYNRISAQNTYLKMIVETGIISTLFLLLVYLFILIYGLKYIIELKDFTKIFIYISFLMVILYGFILVTIQGAIAWIIIGLSLSLINKRKIQ